MAAANRVGQTLVDTYRIERLIAEGGMGSVFEARHLRLPKRFAVKFLNLNLVNNAEAQARFRREAEIIAALDHPNIVNLLDYNVTDEGVPFIVMEYLDGEHLGKRIGRGRIPIPEAMRIIAPVVQALSAAHDRDIVHRDLKPENIVLVRGGEMVKVVDFGIAKIRHGQDLTAANMILGTIPYMAPEQLFGTSIGPKTDQFALAAILYEMLSGEMAFGGPQSVPEVAARVAHHQPPFLAGIGTAVNEVMLQGMAKNADARFSSVRSFYEGLVEAASRPPEEAPVIVDLGEEGGLPELQGEATTITVAPSAPPPEHRGLADEDAGSRPPTGVYESEVERRSFGEDTGNRPAAAPFDPDATQQRHAAPKVAIEPDLATAPLHTIPTDLPALSTVQLDKASITPAPVLLRETAQVNKEQLAALGLEGLAGAPTENVPALRKSAMGVWIGVGIAAAIALALAAWALFIRRPM